MMSDLQKLPWHDSDIYELIIDESTAIIICSISLCATPDDEDDAPLRKGWLIFHHAQLTSDPIQLPAISEYTGISAEILRIEWIPSAQSNLFHVKLFVQLIDGQGSGRSYALLDINYTTALWCETQAELLYNLPASTIDKFL